MLPEKVDQLINNENTDFTKEDKEELLKLNEKALDKLFPKKKPQNNEDGNGKVTKEQLQEVFSQYDDPAKFIEEMIPGGTLKGTLKSSLDVYKQQRQNMINEIKTNSQSWSDEELNKLDDNMLKKLHESVVTEQTNYLGFGGEGVEGNGDDGEYDMSPASLENDNK